MREDIHEATEGARAAEEHMDTHGCRNTSCVLDALSISASISVVHQCGSGKGKQSALSMAGGSTLADVLGSTIPAPPVASGATLANSAVTGHVTVMGTPLCAAVATSLLRQ